MARTFADVGAGSASTMMQDCVRPASSHGKSSPGARAAPRGRSDAEKLQLSSGLNEGSTRWHTDDTYPFGTIPKLGTASSRLTMYTEVATLGLRAVR